MSESLLNADEALAMIRDAAAPLTPQSRPVGKALGRVTSDGITSPAALPPFDNSAMDGFALGGADGPAPAGTELAIAGEQAAGDDAARAGEGAWSIMTGARLPDGFDRVIPVERVERLANPERIRLRADVAGGENIRKAGTDVARDEVILSHGTLLAPQHLMLLSALGVAEVSVAPRPRVAVLSTGRELVDDPAQALKSGQIRNSNGPFLSARVPLAGAELAHVETVGDDIDAFLAAFERARDAGADVVLSSGAVSMGDYDFVPRALQRLNAEVLFHKLAIRPGKPLLFARLPDDVLFFGLPGNPIAAAVGQRFFVETALRGMLDMPVEQPWRVPLAAEYTRGRPLRYHLKSRLALNQQGCMVVDVLPGQQSYRIRPLAAANAWTVVPADAAELPAGSLVDVYGLGHLESPRVEAGA
jgi:molybdopterin molybdotransferase